VARQQADDTIKLKRERAGRYVTADGRFAVEGNAAGTWYMVDAERLDGLGLPLVRGPYATLDAARDAVAEAQRTPAESGTAPPPKPKQERSARAHAPAEPAVPGTPAPPPPKSSARQAAREEAEPARGKRATKPEAAAEAKAEKKAGAAKEAAADVPAWMARLEPEEQATARRLLALLERAGIDEPGLVRREIEADLPEVARALLARGVQRDVMDRWSAGADAIRELVGESTSSAAGATGTNRTKRPTGGARDARSRAARAAVKRLIARADPEDLALLAWLVALQTSAGIFEALAQEGRDAGQGLRGWRLVELGAGRAATGRTLGIDEPDLLAE
jgi:hypothetical protein